MSAKLQQAHPATDIWMRGDRYGTVIKVGKRFLTVRMDRSGKARKFFPYNLTIVEA